ncbi:MAG TPA: YicC family protein [bacterium]|nr:YicC family protein [bacterium]
MTMYSMTGYGKGRAALGNGEVSCEVSAVNNRSLAIVFRLPHELREWEPELRDWLKGSVLRGKVTVAMNLSGSPLLGQVRVDAEKANAIAAAAKKLQAEHPYLAPLSVGELLLVEGVVETRSAAVDTDAVRAALKEALANALEAFNRARELEGDNLVADIRQRIEMIHADLDTIRELAQDAPREYREKLTANLARLAPDLQFDPVRVAQEIALAAENCDIHEELVRLDSHLTNAAQLLEAEGEVGRRLDFVAQELLREANTIGSKTITLAISRAVLRIKGEIDKIKEQVQNLE